MRILAHIGWLLRQEVGDDVFLRLAEIYPHGVTGAQRHVFRSMLPIDDQRTVDILDLLHRALFVPWHATFSRGPREPGHHYQLVLHREYENSDLEQFRLFEFRIPAEAGLYSVERKPNGRLEFAFPISPDDVDTAAWDFLNTATIGHWYICPPRVRDALVCENLRHIRFQAVDTFARRDPSEPLNDQEIIDSGGPFGELTSDFILPPVSPAVELVDKDKKRVWPGADHGLIRAGGLYAWPELHYRASDLRAIEPFDVARTFESLGGNPTMRDPDYCPLIISKRFYDVCQQHGFKVNWLPVHIDPI